MKFLHTSDWQIGMRAVQAGRAGETVRRARLETAARVCALAAAERVDFLVLAGDTFENNAVDRELVVQIAKLLDGAGCRVYVLPGNHDPLQPGSVWEHPAWGSARNVTVLREQAPVDVPGGVLLPCPTRSRRSEECPAAWIGHSVEDRRVRVVVAHGNAGLEANGEFPISLDAPQVTGADYLALGHWHTTRIFNPRLAYSGTHEPTKFGEPDSGNVLLVSIAGPRITPEIRQVRTAALEWRTIERTITAQGMLADVARDLAAVPAPDRTLIHILLRGLLFESDAGELRRIERLAPRFLYFRCDQSALRPAPEDTAWIHRLPAGAAQIAAARLKEMSGGPDGDVATQALLELYAIAQEVRS